jgi:hypothetical protein
MKKDGAFRFQSLIGESQSISEHLKKAVPAFPLIGISLMDYKVFLIPSPSFFSHPLPESEIPKKADPNRQAAVSRANHSEVQAVLPPYPLYRKNLTIHLPVLPIDASQYILTTKHHLLCKTARFAGCYSSIVWLFQNTGCISNLTL